MDLALMMMIVKLVEIFAPHIIKRAEDLIAKHIEPSTVNPDQLRQLYGKSIEELQAEGNRQAGGEVGRG